MSMCFSVGVYSCKEQCGVCVYVNKDCNFASAYSVKNNVLKGVLSSAHAVGKVVMHLSWLSSRSAFVFLLPFKCHLLSFTKLSNCCNLYPKESISSQS